MIPLKNTYYQINNTFLDRFNCSNIRTKIRRKIRFFLYNFLMAHFEDLFKIRKSAPGNLERLSV
jgi:hypothetical protein